MTIKQAVRERILYYCAQKHLTVNGLSTRCGSRSPRCKISSVTKPQRHLVHHQKICDGLDISVVEFFSCELFENLEQELQ